MSKTYLAAVGDVNDIRTWSGIPYHLLQEARRQGVMDAGLPLTADGGQWQARRYAWNLGSLLLGRGRGGYQYSEMFLERLWARQRGQLGGCRVVNCFQLYPPSWVADESVELWFHLDQTLLQLFDTYGVRAQIGRRIAADALERERAGYERATGILMHSRWAADSVIRDYGIAAKKVSVVVPGANLDPAVYEAWAAGRAIPTLLSGSALKLVFVGKEPQRKGLDRLLRGLALARSQGANCTLSVIGCPRDAVPAELRESPGVEWVGFIDKRHDGQRYLNAVAECDVGCLLSRAEAGGIGLREFHALGLAVIGPDVGGSPDHALTDAAILIKPEAGDQFIADVIVGLDHDRDRVAQMKALSWARRSEVLWAATVARMVTVFDQMAS